MIKAIMAVDNKMGIGKNGTLPWPANSEDLKQFKNKTINNIVVMGSKTWDDPCFPAPLKERRNFVISNSSRVFEGAKIINGDLEDAILELDYTNLEDVWIIGGASIINQLKNIIQEFHITIMHNDYNCDTFLDMNIFDDFQLSKMIELDNTYKIYKRISDE